MKPLIVTIQIKDTEQYLPGVMRFYNTVDYAVRHRPPLFKLLSARELPRNWTISADDLTRDHVLIECKTRDFLVAFRDAFG